MAPFSENVTKKAKQQSWETIRNQMHSVGADVDSVSKLGDVIWATIHRGTLKKNSESKKTGAGGSGQLTELDETVLQIWAKRVPASSPLMCKTQISCSERK